MSSKKITTVTLKNRSTQPIIIRRQNSGLHVEILPFSGIGLHLYKQSGFLSIDWDARTVWYDFGDED